MKTIGIASIASLLLFSSIAPALAMPTATVSNTLPNQPTPAAVEAAPEDYIIDDAEAPADTKIKRDKAIELSKQYVTISSGYKLISMSYQSVNNTSQTRGAWSIFYSKENKQNFYGDINVTIDADSGKLLSFYITENDPDKKYAFPPKVNLEQAKLIALDYISKMSPDEQAQLQYDDEYEKTFLRPLVGEVEYPLNYFRVVNGVVFPSNYIILSVNGEGQVRSYTKEWDTNLVFKAPVKPISVDQAAEQFKKLSEVHLQYIVPNQPNGSASPAVAYQMDPIMLDAETGEALSLSGSKMDTQPKPIPVSEKPLAEGGHAPLNLTKEQAASRVASLLPLPAGAMLQESTYTENTDPVTGVTSFEWELSWSVTSDKQDGPNIYATVDSSTGAILRYSKYDYTVAETVAETPIAQPSQGSISYEQLKAKAIETVKQLLPSYAHELFLQPQYVDMVSDGWSQMYDYDFYFNRIINGVFAQYDSVNLHLNRRTGAVEEFSSNLKKSLYPVAPPKVISQEQAKEVLLSQYHFQQQYVFVDERNSADYIQKPVPVVAPTSVASGTIKEPILNKPETKLVYNLKSIFHFREPTYLDATTGVWKNNETNAVVQPRISDPVDLKGHRAEEALKLMMDYEVLDVVDGKIKPDGLITRGELVKMLIATLNGGYFPVASDYAERAASFSDVNKDSKYFPFVENAIDYNLIDRATGIFQPDAALNRTEVADLIVRALGYRKLSQVEGLFNNKATDIDDLTNKGAIAIVSSLQIMALDGDTFSPYEQVTRAQAATTLYNFLKALSQLQDTSVVEG